MPVRKTVRRVGSVLALAGGGIVGRARRRVGRVLEQVGLGAAQPDAGPVRPAPVESTRPAEVPVAPQPSVSAAAGAPAPETAGPPLLTREQVERLFEDMVRPALQSDGGDLTLVKVEDNDVYVELVGACQTCPSAIVTMQMGIERLLQEEFPHFGRLIRVDA